MDGALKVTKGSVMILKIECKMNLYMMIKSVVIDDASVEAEKENTTRLWYMCFGHVRERGLRALHRKWVLSGIKHCKLNLCKFCIMDRQSRVAFTTSVYKTKGLLDLIHILGTSPVASIGASYYVTFIKDFLSKGMGILLETEIRGISEVWGVQSHGREIERVKGAVPELRKWGEYTSTKFKEYLVSEDIENQLSIPGRSEENGEQSAWIRYLQSVPAVWGYKLICQKVFRQRQWVMWVI